MFELLLICFMIGYLLFSYKYTINNFTVYTCNDPINKLCYLEKSKKMNDYQAPDLVGVLSGAVPIRVEASVSMQSIIMLMVAIILANVISRAIIK